MPAAQFNPAFSDEGIKAIRHLLDKFKRVGHPGCLNHFGLAGGGPAKEDVFTHAAIEQKNILQHHSHSLMQGIQVPTAYINPVHAHGAGVNVVKPGNEAGESCLPYSGRPNQSQRASGGNFQADILQNQIIPLVAKAYVLEADVSLDRLGRLNGLSRGFNLWCDGENFRDPLKPSHGLQHSLPGVAESAHRLIERLQVQVKSDQVRHGKLPGNRHAAAEIDDRQLACARKEVQQGAEGGHHAQCPQVKFEIVFNLFVHFLKCHLFMSERLNFTDATEVIVEYRVKFSKGLLALAEHRAYIARIEAHPDQDQRYWEKRDQREAYIHTRQDETDTD